MRHAIKMLWWRFLTRLHLLLASNRHRWTLAFAIEPSLYNARHYADRPDLGMELMASQTFAGFYNDHMPHGHLSAQLALKIYREGKGK
jgi:hypothetical protein